MDASVVADAYRSVQRRAAIRWVQDVRAGWDAGLVADTARERFAVGDDPGGRLEEAYQAAAKQRLNAADGWLAGHGNRPDDDQQEDSRAETVAKFGIIPKHAKKMVDAYDTRQRASAVASVEDLTKNRSAAQALPEIVNKNGATPGITTTPSTPSTPWGNGRPRSRRPNSAGGAASAGEQPDPGHPCPRRPGPLMEQVRQAAIRFPRLSRYTSALTSEVVQLSWGYGTSRADVLGVLTAAQRCGGRVG